MNEREFLRHTLATLAYRAAKATRDVPDTFAGFRAAPESRSAVEILAHMGDLFDWALSMANGTAVWKERSPAAWTDERARFFAALRRFDARLAAADPVSVEPAQLFQGPIADALVHTGQIAMLRRLHGAPVRGESYNRADIQIGRVGAEQQPADPRYEFD
jgi:hypothetical protein